MCKLGSIFLCGIWQERLSERDKDHVAPEGSQHHTTAGGVHLQRPPLYDHRVHGERRPQPVPVPPRTRGATRSAQQHPHCQVRGVMVPVGGCFCVHILYSRQMTLFLSSLQLQQPVLHGRSDRLGDEVPLLIEFCPSRLGHTQLPGGKKLHHKDS